MRIGLAIAVLGLVGLANRAEAQGTPSSAAGSFASGPYRRGEIGRVSRDLAEFRLGRAEGVHAGARLLVVRPSAGDVVVDELVVTIVGDGQSVGKSQRHGLKPGDAVLIQNADTMGGRYPTTNPDGVAGLFGEVTLYQPPAGETRKTFNVMIERVSFLGLVDVRDLEVILFGDLVRRQRLTLLPWQIKQLKLNGNLFVPDPPKRSLVTAEIHDFRESLRAEEARRERIRLSELASAERIKIAESQAQIAADSAERIRLHELAATERIELARLTAEREASLAKAREEERRRVEALAAIARAEAAKAASERPRGPTAAPYPAFDSTQWEFIDTSSSGGGPGGLTKDDVKTIYDITMGSNAAYKGLRDLGFIKGNERSEQLSSGLDVVKGFVDVGKAIFSH
jgi:hypothetical protein